MVPGAGDPRGDERELPWNSVLTWIEREVAFAAARYRLSVSAREELRQDMCVKVLESLRGFDPAGAASLKTWVRRHAVWAVADHWRERGRHARVAGATDDALLGDLRDRRADDPSGGAIRDELRDALQACIAKLTPTQRERFLAAHHARGEADTLASIAARMGVSRETMKETVARARVLLRECLRRAGFSPLRAAPDPPDGPATTEYR